MIIDISKYQGKIDWAKIKSNKEITGVYIKSTEGAGYIDPKFKEYVIGASAVEMRVGFYHFATLNSNDVLTDSAGEAKCFYEATKGIKTALPFVLDIEKNDFKLSPEEVVKWIQNFVLSLRDFGINDVVLYSYAPFLNANLPKNHSLGLTLPLWIAAYTKSLVLPFGWNKYWLWQYTNEGVVDGIDGHVDLNRV